MKALDRIIRYSGILVFGFASVITVLTATTMMYHWDGVIQFLFGA